MPKVLVVEDSNFQRKQIVKTLEEINIQAIQAKHGLEGLEALKSSDFDLIMTDLLMPELDGIGFLRELKKNSNTTPIIVFTSDVQIAVKDECLALGASSFINKPINKEEIHSSVKDILNLG